MTRLLEMLMASFDYVVVDTASGLDEATLAALELSTDLVLLSAPDVPCVRGTRRATARNPARAGSRPPRASTSNRPLRPAG